MAVLTPALRLRHRVDTLTLNLACRVCFCRCQACPAGTFQSVPNMNSTCQPCRYDSYTTGTGSTSAAACLPCPKGQYRSAANGSKCVACPNAKDKIVITSFDSTQGYANCCHGINSGNCVRAQDFPQCPCPNAKGTACWKC